MSGPSAQTDDHSAALGNATLGAAASGGTAVSAAASAGPRPASPRPRPKRCGFRQVSRFWRCCSSSAASATPSSKSRFAVAAGRPASAAAMPESGGAPAAVRRFRTESARKRGFSRFSASSKCPVAQRNETSTSTFASKAAASTPTAKATRLTSDESVERTESAGDFFCRGFFGARGSSPCGSRGLDRASSGVDGSATRWPKSVAKASLGAAASTAPFLTSRALKTARLTSRHPRR
mmetsp:Transcript_5846/g.18591  ORF Transcript_5846/g.18591 Transcript_5846/m.18591 type:complete len:236 (-) Transcript_5846:148-855(-)